MNSLDWWSILTGVASILSLLLTLGERFATWRRYILPLSYGLGGFAIGRLSFVLPSGMGEIASDPHIAGLLIVFFVVLAAVSIAAFFLLRAQQVMLAYFVFFMGLSSVTPQIMRLYSESTVTMPFGDYLLLAAEKERRGDIAGAIDCLKLAEKRAPSKALADQIAKQSTDLQARMAASLFQKNPNSTPTP